MQPAHLLVIADSRLCRPSCKQLPALFEHFQHSPHDSGVLEARKQLDPVNLKAGRQSTGRATTRLRMRTFLTASRRWMLSESSSSRPSASAPPSALTLLYRCSNRCACARLTCAHARMPQTLSQNHAATLSTDTLCCPPCLISYPCQLRDVRAVSLSLLEVHCLSCNPTPHIQWPRHGTIKTCGRWLDSWPASIGALTRPWQDALSVLLQEVEVSGLTQ